MPSDECMGNTQRPERHSYLGGLGAPHPLAHPLFSWAMRTRQPVAASQEFSHYLGRRLLPRGQTATLRSHHANFASCVGGGMEGAKPDVMTEWRVT